MSEEGKYIMRNVECEISTMYNLRNIRCRNLLISVQFAGRRSVLRIGGTEEQGPKGRSLRHEGPRQGVGFLGGGQLAPSPEARGLGERCKLPHWGPGRSSVCC